MGRKLKYKDVVRTTKNHSKSSRKPTKKTNQKSKFNKPKNRSFSDFRQNKPKNHKPYDRNSDKKEVKEKIVEQEAPIESSSESEEEIDYLKQLRKSFGLEVKDNVVSESDSDEENEEVEEMACDEEIEENVSASSEADSEDEDPPNEVASNESDPFLQHFIDELHPSVLESLESTPQALETNTATWPKLGDIIFKIPHHQLDKIQKSELEEVKYAIPGPIPQIQRQKTSDQLFIRPGIAGNFTKLNGDKLLTRFQEELFSVMNSYMDLFYPERSFGNEEEIRNVYCLHVINHVLKTRSLVVQHNKELEGKDDVPDSCRDQGLVRPKVLIVVPFKNSAYKIINTIINIMFKEDKGNVINRKRFIEDYTGNELYFPKKNPKPEDYQRIFTGNTGDDFKIGMSVTKKSLKLYADFYSSDIMVASPLGLRTIIGAEGEPDRNFDFLTSIELLILDQTDVFLMQNWDHIYHIFDHLHLKPKDLHGTNVFRVRHWCLNLWAKYYRQTLVFSSVVLPEINCLFSKYCHNFAGKVVVANAAPQYQCIRQIHVNLPHVFQKFNATSALDAIEKRFDFFVRNVLTHPMDQVLVYIPSYFDFVKIRNYFKRQDLSFVQICEYTKEGKVARARDMFYHGDARFLLYTERHHFYNRIRVKGIRHLVFYQPPNFPQFYAELCNLMQEANMNKKVGSMIYMTVTVIYSKYDAIKLGSIVGDETAAKMVESDSDVHTIVPGD